jgi:Tfp pilus tip-associated adhesin PilY1
MENFERELEAVVDEFTRKKEEIKQKQEKEKVASDQRMQTFQQIVTDIISPLMLECRDFINKKGQVSTIESTGLGDIIFEIQSKTSQRGVHMANITFSLDTFPSGKIKIVQKIEYQTVSEEYCEEIQLTKDYVRSKLIDIVKKFYDESLKYV